MANTDYSLGFTAWKVSKYGAFSCPNTGKYGPEKTPHLDIWTLFTEWSCLPSQLWLSEKRNLNGMLKQPCTILL